MFDLPDLIDVRPINPSILFAPQLAASRYTLQRDFIDANKIPLPQNCQLEKPQGKRAASASDVEPPPKRSKEDPLYFWEDPVSTPVISSLLLDGTNTPSKAHVNEFWSDLFDILASVSHSARVRDLEAMDGILSAWFPSASGDIRITAAMVEGGKAIFVSEFCTLLGPVVKGITAIKIMELWDSVVQIMVWGPGDHYLKRDLARSVSDYRLCGIKDIGSLFVMPAMMCISMEANATMDSPPTNGDHCILDSNDPSPKQNRSATMNVMMVWFISFLKMVDAISPTSQHLVVAKDATQLIQNLARKWVTRSQLLLKN
jgi:hypothetical protein